MIVCNLYNAQTRPRLIDEKKYEEESFSLMSVSYPPIIDVAGLL